MFGIWWRLPFWSPAGCLLTVSLLHPPGTSSPPKGPPPAIVMLGIRFQYMNFGRDPNVQSTAEVVQDLPGSHLIPESKSTGRTEGELTPAWTSHPPVRPPCEQQNRVGGAWNTKERLVGSTGLGKSWEGRLEGRGQPARSSPSRETLRDPGGPLPAQLLAQPLST